MKVLNLRCVNGHGFEGWFGSDEAFDLQRREGRLCCPMCDAQDVHKMPSAPRLNLSGQAEPVRAGRGGERTPAPQGGAAEPSAPQEVQAAWMRVMRHLVDSTEDVGSRFADEARAIHYGDAQTRAIRGQATDEDRAALEDEGIDILTLALPAALKGPLQ